MSISRLLNNSRFLSCRRDGGHVAVKARAHPGENTVFFGHFYTNPNILPSQLGTNIGKALKTEYRFVSEPRVVQRLRVLARTAGVRGA
eukprot:COSAG06_NODE_3132_length_5805_cov_85.931300_8_plen_88_part_00